MNGIFENIDWQAAIGYALFGLVASVFLAMLLRLICAPWRGRVSTLRQFAEQFFGKAFVVGWSGYTQSERLVAAYSNYAQGLAGYQNLMLSAWGPCCGGTGAVNTVVATNLYGSCGSLGPGQ